MNLTEADAHRRTRVRVPGGKEGVLVFVGRNSQQAKVRLDAGYHLTLPLADLQPAEPRAEAS